MQCSTVVLGVQQRGIHTHTHSLTRTLTHSQDPDESQCITEARELVRVVQRDGRADDHHAVEVLQRLQRLRGDHGLHGTETETGTCKSSECVSV